jgi:hypothetical protein
MREGRVVMSGQSGRYRNVLISGAVMLALGCSLAATPVSAQSLTDRIKGLFGGKPDQPPAAQDGSAAPPANQSEMDCPDVSIRAGASTYAVGMPGKEAAGADLRYQVTITKTARDCTRNGDSITARVGIQGRVIAGPAGAPDTVEVPLRVAVVQGGITETTIATKAYTTTVQMSEDGSVPFTLVADDLVYPVPTGKSADSYIFYIGFDPQALAPPPKPRAAKRKK